MATGVQEEEPQPWRFGTDDRRRSRHPDPPEGVRSDRDFRVLWAGLSAPPTLPSAGTAGGADARTRDFTEGIVRIGSALAIAALLAVAALPAMAKNDDAGPDRQSRRQGRHLPPHGKRNEPGRLHLVAPAAVPAHEAHGDTVGVKDASECQATPTPTPTPTPTRNSHADANAHPDANADA